LFVSLKLYRWENSGIGFAGHEQALAYGPECGKGFLVVYDTLEDLRKYEGENIPYVEVEINKGEIE